MTSGGKPSGWRARSVGILASLRGLTVRRTTFRLTDVACFNSSATIDDSSIDGRGMRHVMMGPACLSQTSNTHGERNCIHSHSELSNPNYTNPPGVKIQKSLVFYLRLSFLLFCCIRSSSETTMNSFGATSAQQTKREYKTLILDMDGVLAEVSQSYRAAIVQTCHHFGATSVDLDVISEWKARGNANDDWKLSRDLIIQDPNGRKNVTLEQVTEKFESLYQGHGDTPGLCTLETLIPLRETLLELHRRSKPGIGIVTGRPRKDCFKFLKQYDLESLISASYCMEDGPSKPDPFPVKRCCELLGVAPGPEVVLVGDTPDDMKATISAGCSGVGVTTPEAALEQESMGKPHTSAKLSIAMAEAGADVILRPGFAELIDMFPEP